ncbi:amidase family protein [Caballeronia sp. INML2]|uniref:amidase family protein n=1 Tax=Caballeronia sp. INML2 TaxID=2921748 RepID=UPI0020279D96|nr:amidase family protein [Caballeronia sp. INML2]
MSGESRVEQSRAVSLAFSGLDKVFLRTRFDAAVADAIATDQAVASGASLPLNGLILAVKACFDVAGWVTDAASAVLSDQPEATRDAPVVAGLRAAGATLVAHTNMTEFAFGALGINNTTGTPVTPLDAHGERVAGGSTSGGAVAVARGFADIALGTDTSGSIRIPAAFCGIVGFKPSTNVISTQGCIPLSTTFDAPGFIARDVSTIVRVVEALKLYRTPVVRVRPTRQLEGIRLALPVDFALTGCDPTVVAAFEACVNRLASLGASIVETDFMDLRAPSRIAAESGIIVADAFAWHEPWIRTRLARYDPLVGPRILRGESIPAYRYLKGAAALKHEANVFDAEMARYDALLTPTVPIVPPRIADVTADEIEYLRVNALSFSLTELANRLDAPSIAMQFDPARPRPFGLMLTGRRHRDIDLLSVARRVEAALSKP